MKFPDTVTIFRATAPDVYGNPNASGWTAVATAPGARMGTAVFLPPAVDIRPHDRLRVGGALYAVKGLPVSLGPPGRRVMWVATLDRLPDGA
jgi:hypothetical protein